MVTYALALPTAAALAGRGMYPVKLGGSNVLLGLAETAHQAGFGLELPLLDLPGLRSKAEFDSFLQALAKVGARIDVVRTDETLRGLSLSPTDVCWQHDAWLGVNPRPLVMGEGYSPLLLTPKGMSAIEWAGLIKSSGLICGVGIDTSLFLTFTEDDQDCLLQLLADQGIDLKLLRLKLSVKDYLGFMGEVKFRPPRRLVQERLGSVTFSDNLVVVFDLPPEEVNGENLKAFRERVETILK